jgi:hypothetical protein
VGNLRAFQFPSRFSHLLEVVWENRENRSISEKSRIGKTGKSGKQGIGTFFSG